MVTLKPRGSNPMVTLKPPGGGHYGTDLTTLQKSTDDKLKRTIFTTLQRTTDFNKKSSHMNYTWPEIFLARFLFIESL